MARRVYEAGGVTVRRAESPVVDEVLMGDRPWGDSQPPPFPFVRGLGWLVGCEQVVPAQRAHVPRLFGWAREDHRPQQPRLPLPNCGPVLRPPGRE